MRFTDQGSVIPAEQGGADLVTRSSLYREYLAEHNEILKHKWFESERAGRDIGFDMARLSWIVHHRLRWREAWRAGER